MAQSRRTAPGGEAHALYQEARSHWQKRTPLSVKMAIRCLEQAITLDGTFALACAALADCYTILMDYGVLSPREGLMAARLASGRALHQAPESAEALTSAALVRQMDLDWASAETEFRAAIRGHPKYLVARQRFALFLAYMGRDEESRRQITAASNLDPGSPAVAASEAWVTYYQGQPERAVELAREATLKYPAFSSAEVILALSMVEEGRAPEASVVLERAFAREKENVSLLSLLSYAKGKEGKRSEGGRLLAQLEEWSKDRYVSPYYLAVPHMGLGREEEALSALEAGRVERSPQLAYLLREPIFRPLRETPGFQALLEHVGLPYYPDSRSIRLSRTPPTETAGLHGAGGPGSHPKKEAV